MEFMSDLYKWVHTVINVVRTQHHRKFAHYNRLSLNCNFVTYGDKNGRKFHTDKRIEFITSQHIDGDQKDRKKEVDSTLLKKHYIIFRETNAILQRI